MYLDYSKLPFDANGNPETPVLLLKTLGGDVIGTIPGVHNLRLNIKFSEPSEISFDVPAAIDGEPNWIYDRLTGHKIIYTEHYGVFMTLNPETSSDGVSEIKTVTGYSIEKELETKKFFLEEGTYKFFDQTNQHNPDTVIGRVLEIAAGWHMGYVSPALAQRYRTFSQFDDYLLSFLYNDAPEKYRCVFVFDPYEKSINVYDADEQLETIPLYLDFDNLLEQLDISEVSDELVTALRPYGSDDLDIWDVNPIGTNWIYDLSWFISNGDIPKALADKWVAWQKSILNNRQLYQGLTALRASATASLLSARAALTDLNGELENLTAQQSVTIQAIAMEITDEGRQTQQELLDEINQKIAAKKREIADQEQVVKSFEELLDPENEGSYAYRIQQVVDSLSVFKYFTDEEYATLSHYFIEQDMTEDTFVATSVDTAVSGTNYTLSGEQVSIEGTELVRIDLTAEFGKKMYTLSGGTMKIAGALAVSCDVIRGTVEAANDGTFVLSVYAGTITAGQSTAPSGVLTVSGVMSGWTDDIRAVTEDEVTAYEGSAAHFQAVSGDLYLTANVSDYQKYSVQMELYDYAAGVLSDLATPTFEFSVDSGNFLFAREFAPFRNELELGKGIYLRIGENEVITPYIIEFELDFEEWQRFSIVFSNRFKRHDNCNTLKDMIEQSYSSSRSFDAGKYLYNQAANQASAVSKFMNGSLDAAKNTILAAANQTVVINGAGIHVGGDSDYQLRIVDRMIAITDDGWAHAKLAIGLFASPEIGEYFGVNAEVIGGKLIVGNNLVIENETDNGVMQFKVDASGAWLNNATFLVQSDNGGKILIDPKYGIAAGTGGLYRTDGTTVLPSFVAEDGSLLLDDDGFPENSNFYLDLNTGDAYFRGNLVATSGEIGGFAIAEDFLHTGSGGNYVALNGSGTNAHSAYAIWAGGTSPEAARFWVKKDGTISAKDGIFSGTLSAARLSGNLTADEDSWLIGCGINVGNGNFYVDPSGNVTLAGNINMGSGNIVWGSGNSPVLALYCRIAAATPTLPYNTYPSSGTTSWHRSINDNDLYASYTYDGGSTWTPAIKIRGEDGRDGMDGIDGSDATVTDRAVFDVLTGGGRYFGIFEDSTSNRLYINANYIRTGTIDADEVTLGSSYGGFRCTTGRDSSGNSTIGAKMYGADEDFYFIATDAGCRIQTPRQSFTLTNNGLFASEEITISSDRRVKNSISYDMGKYEAFFMSLKPSFYRLNSEGSGQFHLGFIAQDVADAISNCGLTRDDFAGLVQCPGVTGAKERYIDQYYLKYGEFISLNAYMIQKLVRRADELERRIQELEEKE